MTLWEADELNKVKELYMKGWSPAKISRLRDINRSRMAIIMKLQREDISRPRPTYMTHYRCREHSWVLPEDAVTVNGILCCPYCETVVKGKLHL